MHSKYIAVIRQDELSISAMNSLVMWTLTIFYSNQNILPHFIVNLETTSAAVEPTISEFSKNILADFKWSGVSYTRSVSHLMAVVMISCGECRLHGVMSKSSSLTLSMCCTGYLTLCSPRYKRIRELDKDLAISQILSKRDSIVLLQLFMVVFVGSNIRPPRQFEQLNEYQEDFHFRMIIIRYHFYEWIYIHFIWCS